MKTSRCVLVNIFKHVLLYSFPFLLIMHSEALPSQNNDSLDDFEAIVEFESNAKFDSLFQLPDSFSIGYGSSLLADDTNKITPEVIDMLLQCICGLKVGYYNLPVKYVKNIKTLRVRNDITALAEQCCSYASLKKLYKANKCNVVLTYWKDKKIWIIKK